MFFPIQRIRSHAQMNKNPTNHLVHLTLLQLLQCSRSELNYICCPSHKWLRIHLELKMEKIEQIMIYDLVVQFPQRLKSTFLRFLLFYSFSTDPLWTIPQRQRANSQIEFIFQILIHHGLSSSTEPSTFLILSKGSLNIISKCSASCMVSHDQGKPYLSP